MFGAYRQWRHAGEENAVAVFNYSIRADLSFIAVLCATFWLVLSVTSDDGVRYVIGVLNLLAGIRVLAKRRIAITFTTSEVIYRSALASPQRVRMRGVQAIRRGLIYILWETFPLAWGARVKGVVLEFPYGQSSGWICLMQIR